MFRFQKGSFQVNGVETTIVSMHFGLEILRYFRGIFVIDVFTVSPVDPILRMSRLPADPILALFP